MMYCEFVAGTGCKDNEYNYKVFKNLESMYMNTKMTKAEIYEYGKKLVDNSKSEKQIEFENNIKAEIESLENELKYTKREADRYAEYFRTEPKESMYRKIWRADEKRLTDECSRIRNKIKMLKSIIEA